MLAVDPVARLCAHGRRQQHAEATQLIRDRGLGMNGVQSLPVERRAWYRDRAIHIHCRAQKTGRRAVTAALEGELLSKASAIAGLFIDAADNSQPGSSHIYRCGSIGAAGSALPAFDAGSAAAAPRRELLGTDVIPITGLYRPPHSLADDGLTRIAMTIDARVLSNRLNWIVPLLLRIAPLFLLPISTVLAGRTTGFGPNPSCRRPKKQTIPTVKIAPAKPWAGGTRHRARPRPARSMRSRPASIIRAGCYVLPNGDVLVAETNAPERPGGSQGICAAGS